MLAVAGVTVIEVNVELLLLPQAARKNARTTTVARSAPVLANLPLSGILVTSGVRDLEL